MAKINKFDENFLEYDSLNFKEKAIDINRIIHELKGSNLCSTERNFFLKCIKEERQNLCENLKNNIVNCLKNSGKFIS